jgi:hypothetical protein
MRINRKFILPVIGLLLFALGSWQMIRFNRTVTRGSKYFYWSSIRLDSDPRNRNPAHNSVSDCADTPNCVQFDLPFLSLESGLVAQVFMISAFPAFLIGKAIARAMARAGVSEVTTFMIVMPVLIFAWYCLVARAFSSLLHRGRRGSAELRQQTWL